MSSIATIDAEPAAEEAPAAPSMEQPKVGLGELLAPARVPLAVAVGLYVISSLAAIVPFLAVVELARTLAPLTIGADVDTSRA